MYFSKHDIAQLDPHSLISMDKENLFHSLTKIVSDLKEATDRLNQNSSNSSRPSSSDSPWESKASTTHDIDWVREALQEMLASSSNDPSQNSIQKSTESSTQSSKKNKDSSQNGNSSSKKKARKQRAAKRVARALGEHKLSQ
jgi:transposase